MKSRALAILSLCVSLGLGSSAQAGRRIAISGATNGADNAAASVPFTAPPYTVVSYERVAASGSYQNALRVWDGASEYVVPRISGTAGNLAIGGATTSLNINEGTVVADQWHHVAGRSTTSSSHFLFFDGSKGTESTTDIGTQSNMDRVSVQGYNGANAEFIVGPMTAWDVALTDAQIGSLAAGRDPRTLAEMPKVHLTTSGQINDVITGEVYTENGTYTYVGHKPLGWE